MRLTFKKVEEFAKRHGVIIERDRGGFSFWNPNDCSSVGWAKTLREAYDDLGTFV